MESFFFDHLFLPFKNKKTVFVLYYYYWAGMVGAVGKISAFRPQGPQFDPGSAEI